jgi:hypothetical protein
MSNNTTIKDFFNTDKINNIEPMTLLLGVIVFFILFLFITQYCWNNTISIITGTQNITIWQTFLLLILFHILFNNGTYIIKK